MQLCVYSWVHIYCTSACEHSLHVEAKDFRDALYKLKPFPSSSPLSLHLRETHVNLDLFLWRQLLLHLRLEPAEKEWPQYSVESVYQSLVFQLALVEPGIKILGTEKKQK